MALSQEERLKIGWFEQLRSNSTGKKRTVVNVYEMTPWDNTLEPRVYVQFDSGAPQLIEPKMVEHRRSIQYTVPAGFALNAPLTVACPPGPHGCMWCAKGFGSEEERDLHEEGCG